MPVASKTAKTAAAEKTDSNGEGQSHRRVSDRIQPLIDRVLSADSITPILQSLTQDLIELFDAQGATIYSIDRAKKQIFSWNFLSKEGEEIRLDISPKSLAGYVSFSGKSVKVASAYDKKELSKIHPELAINSTWDKKLKLKTLSVLATPLHHNKKLMGVLEIINKKSLGAFSDNDLRLAKELGAALGHALVKLELELLEEKIRSTAHAIHSAESVDAILLELQKPLLQLFESAVVTIYAVDAKSNTIYSKMKTGDTINEIRVPISTKSIAGCVALEKRIVNISDVYNKKELKDYHAELSFDSSWDKKSGFKTKSMLVSPLIHNEKIMGVLQLINKQGESNFNVFDEKNIRTISETLALAFFNQKKQASLKPTKFSYLLNNGLITQNELTQAISKARKSGIDAETILLDEVKLQRKDLGKSLEVFYNIPYYGYSDSMVLPKSLFAGLNTNYLAKNHWLPLQRDEDKVVILTNNPLDQDKTQNIKLIFPKKKIEFKVGLRIDISDFLNATPEDDDGPLDVEVETEEMSSLLSALQSEKEDSIVEASSDEDELSAISETDSTIVRLVNKILIDAYDEGISDIHIEPGQGKKAIRVRYRKDGICRIYQEIPYLYRQALLSRIKIMSKLDIAERRMPQDGKIKMKYGKKEIEYRVATCPTVGGNEDAVLRILAASKPIPLAKMNFSEHNLELIQILANKPYGLILVVGPTGSGKTTTLHSALGYINTPEKKIWTAEDPVEITQDGLRQVQMHNKIGLDFARAMRSFLRGDPDVIMVGEMRDAETSAIGLEASLTGHLVFSTLHTNSAPETITRLLDMGMNPLNFADALLLIVAQRLVRTLCKGCKEEYHPSKEEFETLVQEYGPKDFPNLGITYNDDLMLFGPKGCDKCEDTGYAGRTGLHELLEGTDEMKRLIMKKSLIEDLREQAIKDGMTTLKQDGIWKIFKGDCDLKQVLSVCIV